MKDLSIPAGRGPASESPFSLKSPRLGNASTHEETEVGPDELVFDDEPMAHILYGEGEWVPTAASVFAPSRAIVDRAEEFIAKGEIQRGLDDFSKLVGNQDSLSQADLTKLIGILRYLIPDIPRPVLSWDLRGLDAVLTWAKNLAESSGRSAVIEASLSLQYRYHEHLGHYSEARKILRELVTSAEQRNARASLARYLNNLGFEYLLERRWEEATPYFERATKIVTETGAVVESAVMRANYWTSRIERDGVQSCEGLEAEVHRMQETLESEGDWRERKALMLLARIEHARGNVTKAVDHVRRAIKVAKGSSSLWPELDREYLKMIQRRESQADATGTRKRTSAHPDETE